MVERINVLHMGCRLFYDSGLTRFLGGLMALDSRVKISPQEINRITEYGDWEDKNLPSPLDTCLRTAEISRVGRNPELHQTFNFNFNYQNSPIEMAVDAFGLYEIGKDPQTMDEAREALMRDYDVKSVCGTCFNDYLAINQRERNYAKELFQIDFDSTFLDSPKEIINLARRNISRRVRLGYIVVPI